MRTTRRRTLRALGIPVLLAGVITAGAPGWIPVKIRPGDTLSELAGKYRTSVAVLVALNRLPGNGNLIYAGQWLRMPRPPAPATRPVRSRYVDGTYVVRGGDNLTALAQRFHTTTGWITHRNRLSSTGLILIGQHLVVPVPRVSAAPAAPFGRTYPSAVYAAAARDRRVMARRATPSKRTVRTLVVRTAHRYGLDPNLALAVAYQESGFQQHVVSVADAIGAMQVLPSTGAYVSRYVTGRRLDLFDARDNVTAGVALLRQLTRAAPLDQAIAGYYQGLGSVRRHGMYADTKVYVRSILALRASFARG